MKHRNPRPRLECMIQNAVQVSAAHRDGSVEIAIAVFRQNDFAENPRIPIETVSSPPQSQTRFFLPTPVSESAQQMVCELTVKCFAENNSMLQRVRQILRMCLSK